MGDLLAWVLGTTEGLFCLVFVVVPVTATVLWKSTFGRRDCA